MLLPIWCCSLWCLVRTGSLLNPFWIKSGQKLNRFCTVLHLIWSFFNLGTGSFMESSMSNWSIVTGLAGNYPVALVHEDFQTDIFVLWRWLSSIPCPLFHLIVRETPLTASDFMCQNSFFMILWLSTNPCHCSRWTNRRPSRACISRTRLLPLMPLTQVLSSPRSLPKPHAMQTAGPVRTRTKQKRMHLVSSAPSKTFDMKTSVTSIKATIVKEASILKN